MPDVAPDGSLIIRMDQEGRFLQCAADNLTTPADLARMFWALHGQGSKLTAIAALYGSDELTVATVVDRMDKAFGRWDEV